MKTIYRDSQDAFKNAINKGYMNFATVHGWMYMGTTDKGDETPELVDAFKNIGTREYMRVSA